MLYADWSFHRLDQMTRMAIFHWCGYTVGDEWPLTSDY